MTSSTMVTCTGPCPLPTWLMCFAARSTPGPSEGHHDAPHLRLGFPNSLENGIIGNLPRHSPETSLAPAAVSCRNTEPLFTTQATSWIGPKILPPGHRRHSAGGYTASLSSRILATCSFPILPPIIFTFLFPKIGLHSLERSESGSTKHCMIA
jgi:hypothetical protein